MQGKDSVRKEGKDQEELWRKQKEGAGAERRAPERDPAVTAGRALPQGTQSGFGEDVRRVETGPGWSGANPWGQGHPGARARRPRARDTGTTLMASPRGVPPRQNTPSRSFPGTLPTFREGLQSELPETSPPMTRPLSPLLQLHSKDFRPVWRTGGWSWNLQPMRTSSAAGLLIKT